MQAVVASAAHLRKSSKTKPYLPRGIQKSLSYPLSPKTPISVYIPFLQVVMAAAAHLRKSFKAGRMLMSVAPFAVATSSAGSANTLVLVTRAVGSFIKLYLLLLFLRVLLSWFPKFEWDVQPWLALRQVGFMPVRAQGLGFSASVFRLVMGMVGASGAWGLRSCSAVLCPASGRVRASASSGLSVLVQLWHALC